MLEVVNLKTRIDGFGSMVDKDGEENSIRSQTTDEYANAQLATHERKTMNFLLPQLEEQGAKTVLDCGCGLGRMVDTLVKEGYNAYGIDLVDLVRFWSQSDLPKERYYVVCPTEFKLPFVDQSFDFIYSFGVIEHVGTTNGHSTRHADYHHIRQQWVHELFRILKPGGKMLLGGPNRNFPFDVAHGPDSEQNFIEEKLSKLFGVTTHRIWGENFLWGFSDVDRYTEGLDCSVLPKSIEGYIDFGRVPRALKPLVNSYVRLMPKPLLGTGFNPWMMATIERNS